MSIWRKIVITLLFLVGFGIMLYPAVSNLYNSYRFTTEANSYEGAVMDLTEEELKKEWRKVKIYNDNLNGDPVRDPFVPGSGGALPKDYEECLNVNDVMATIEIPKIHVNLPIYHGTSEETLKKGIGHIEGTALPEGAKGCHPVLTGHTGLPEAKLFTDLTKMEVGDYFYLYVLDKKFCYKVDQIKVILPEELDDLKAYQAHDYVTLLTCTPYGINTHRLLVRGERSKEPWEEIGPEPPVELLPVINWKVCAGMIGILFLKKFIGHRRRKRKQS